MTEYIRREDLMERVGRWQLNTREAIAEMIMSVPSADVVERKRGEWIDPADLICYKCTACGDYANQGYGLDAPIFWDYCPNCGADMRETK